MAKADYCLCNVCDEKCFYDSNLNYEFNRETGKIRLDYMTDVDEQMVVICDRCFKEWDIKIVRRVTETEDKSDE